MTAARHRYGFVEVEEPSTLRGKQVFFFFFCEQLRGLEREACGVLVEGSCVPGGQSGHKATGYLRAAGAAPPQAAAPPSSSSSSSSSSDSSEASAGARAKAKANAKVKAKVEAAPAQSEAALARPAPAAKSAAEPARKRPRQADAGGGGGGGGGDGDERWFAQISTHIVASSTTRPRSRTARRCAWRGRK